MGSILQLDAFTLNVDIVPRLSARDIAYLRSTCSQMRELIWAPRMTRAYWLREQVRARKYHEAIDESILSREWICEHFTKIVGKYEFCEIPVEYVMQIMVRVTHWSRSMLRAIIRRTIASRFDARLMAILSQVNGIDTYGSEFMHMVRELSRMMPMICEYVALHKYDGSHMMRAIYYAIFGLPLDRRYDILVCCGEYNQSNQFHSELFFNDFITIIAQTYFPQCAFLDVIRIALQVHSRIIVSVRDDECYVFHYKQFTARTVLRAHMRGHISEAECFDRMTKLYREKLDYIDNGLSFINYKLCDLLPYLSHRIRFLLIERTLHYDILHYSTYAINFAHIWRISKLRERDLRDMARDISLIHYSDRTRSPYFEDIRKRIIARADMTSQFESVGHVSNLEMLCSILTLREQVYEDCTMHELMTANVSKYSRAKLLVNTLLTCGYELESANIDVCRVFDTLMKYVDGQDFREKFLDDCKLMTYPHMYYWKPLGAYFARKYVL